MSLEQLNKQQLSNKAKTLGVANFASLKREDLVKAILRAQKKKDAEKAEIWGKGVRKQVVFGEGSECPARCGPFPGRYVSRSQQGGQRCF